MQSLKMIVRFKGTRLYDFHGLTFMIFKMHFVKKAWIVNDRNYKKNS